MSESNPSGKRGAVRALLGLLCAVLAALVCAALWTAIGQTGFFAPLTAILAPWPAAGIWRLLRARTGGLRAAAVLSCMLLTVLLGTLGSLGLTTWNTYDASLEASYDDAIEEAVSGYAKAMQSAARTRLTEANPKDEYVADLKANYPQFQYTLDSLSSCWQDA